jgi:Tol biopolymer transport system component/tRNA A-37 threonylcarbamoyl transferase component Bud32
VSRWQQIESLFQEALERPPSEREEYLRRSCLHDPDLYDAVMSLTAHDPGQIDQDAWAAAAAAQLIAGSPTLDQGDRVGPYEIVSFIAAGGMGSVYRARDPRMDRDVAIKVCFKAFTDRFAREVRASAALNHPNVCHVYDVGPNYLVMELIDGATLEERLRTGRIPLREALDIAAQVARGLHIAHDHGVIHCDLKPGNIKITSDGTVKVLDFGLAKMLDPLSSSATGTAVRPEREDSSTITASALTAGMILGTAAYMAPEQATGQPADRRSDIWAFGCVLFEIFSGTRAFSGKGTWDALASVLQSEPDWSLLPRDVPTAVQVLIRRCLAKDRAQRVTDISVAQFVLADPAGLTGSVDGALPMAPARRVWWKSIAGIGAAVLLTAIIVGAAASWWRSQAAAPTVVRFVLTLPRQNEALANTGRQIMAISPDGTRIVYETIGLGTRLYVRSISDFDAHGVPGSEGQGVHSPAFSPDGRSVVYFSRGTLKRTALGEGTSVTLCAAESPFGITWDASGIILGQGRKGIVRCSPNGGPAEQLATVRPDELAHAPQLLPDGEHLLFTVVKASLSPTTNWDRAQVVVQSLKSGERKTVIDAGSDGRYVSTGHLLYAVGGVILAVPFDLVQLQPIGRAVPVVEGVSRTRGTGTGMAHIAISPSGTLVYVPGPATPAADMGQLALADRTGLVTPLKLPPGPYVDVRASRDGKQLVLDSDDGKEAIVWIYDMAATSSIRRLTLPLEGQNRFSIWSPDGHRVVFQSDREGDLALFAQQTSGNGAVERLTKPENGEAHIPGSWSRDGKHLAFTVVKEGRYSLWMLSFPERTTAPFGHVTSAEPIEPVFSPDGRWIAYASGPTSNEGSAAPDRGVFIEPVPPTGARYQVPKQLVDFHPLWSADGRELFYTASMVSGQMAVARVATQPVVTFGTPEQFPARVTADRLSNEPRAYDVLPDGRFIGLTSVPGTNPQSSQGFQLRVVLNWFEELKQRVPVK